MNIEDWADVSIGSLYYALKSLAADGLVEPVRVEKSGNFPTRQIFALTPEGERVLTALIDATLADVALPPDPFDVAFTAGLGRDLHQVPGAIAARMDRLTTLLAELRSRRDRLLAAKQIGTRAQVVFRHQELRLEAEIRFHHDLEARMPQLLREAELWATGTVHEDAVPPADPASPEP